MNTAAPYTDLCVVQEWFFSWCNLTCEHNLLCFNATKTGVSRWNLHTLFPIGLIKKAILSQSTWGYSGKILEWLLKSKGLAIKSPRPIHDKQTSSQIKCREHLSNQPSHRDNVTHQGISISQPCYEDGWMECLSMLRLHALNMWAFVWVQGWHIVLFAMSQLNDTFFRNAQYSPLAGQLKSQSWIHLKKYGFFLHSIFI